MSSNMQKNEAANGFCNVLNHRSKEDNVRRQGDLCVVSLQKVSQKTEVPKDATEDIHFPRMLSEHFQT